MLSRKKRRRRPDERRQLRRHFRTSRREKLEQVLPLDDRVGLRPVPGEYQARVRALRGVRRSLLEAGPHVQTFVALALDGKRHAVPAERGHAHVLPARSHARREAVVGLQMRESVQDALDDLLLELASFVFCTLRLHGWRR